MRVFHYDVARGAYLLPDVFIRAIRLAAESGFTHFLPYLENMVWLPSMEKSCPACAYTPEQWREFEAAAGKAGIQLVPHFNAIGHTGGATAAYPELFIKGSDGWKLDVTLEAARSWTSRCLDEFCGFSSGKYFLIGGETFVIYPRFGATLQDWRVGGATIIPHALPEFLRGGASPPGGYGSYTSAGGFRPIWALGVHTNPCILWQGPFEWKVAVESEDLIVVELSRRMRHVDVRYIVTARKGAPGFTFQAEAVNKLDDAYGAFNFNLILATQPQDFDETAFAWMENGQERRLRLPDIGDSFFRLPAAKEMTVVKPGYSACIGCDPAKTAGFYVDWAQTYLTPDLRGFYRPMRVGEREVVEWRFTAKERN